MTPALQAELCELMAGGNYLEDACAIVGVADTTVRRWLKQAEDGDAEYEDFRTAYKRAEATAKADALGAIREGGQGWQGNAWFLERRHRAGWGRDAQGDQNAQQPPQVVVVQVPAGSNVTLPEVPK